MFLHYFKKKETEDKQIAELVYRKIINNVNSIISSNSLVLKNNINTTFELTSIFLISIFFGSKLKKNRDDFSILQEIMNLFISDLDYSLRRYGIADMSIGKHVKFYLKKFYFRISNYEKIFENSDIDNFVKFFEELKIFNDRVNKKQIIVFLYSVSNKLIKESHKNKINIDFLSDLYI